MTESIQFYKSSYSGRVLQCAAVASLLVLSGALNSAKSQQETSSVQSQQTKLIVGQPIAREMRGGEKHAYQVMLNAGQYVRVVVEQKGIDVVFGLLGEEEKPLFEVDNNLSGTRGVEIISLVAEVSRGYVFSVRSPDDASPGRYEVRIEDLKAATEADRARVTAERSYLAAAKLQS